MDRLTFEGKFGKRIIHVDMIQKPVRRAENG